MNILNRLSGKRERASGTSEEPALNFACVLLSEAQLPDADAVALAFRDYAVAGEELRTEQGASEDGASAQAISLTLTSGEKSFAALMPTAVPGGEAEHNAQFSLSRFSDNWEPPRHTAHLVVTFHSTPDSPPAVRLSRFTSLLAAVTKASSAVGVYWGSAGATHGSEFFLAVASEQDIAPRMMLWSGVSIVRGEDGRLSLLSLGMEQFDLPNLLLVSGKDSETSAVETMYDLLTYVVTHGEPLPEGNTVGRTGDEHLPVHYVPSPIDPDKTVWRVELP